MVIESFRTCVVTRKRYLKGELTRVVKTKGDEISIDFTNKAKGRGAYILLTKDNIAQARKINAFSRSFRCKVGNKIYDDLDVVLSGKNT